MTRAAMEQLLAPYMERLQVRAGNGLTRNMNQTLRSYPEIPVIIERAATWLARGEGLFGFSGVSLRTMHLFWDLVQEYDDWGVEVPVIGRLTPVEVQRAAEALGEAEMAEIELPDHPAFAGTVSFVRQPALPYHHFLAAMAIGRQIGLFGGHGRIGLDYRVRKALKRMAAPEESAAEVRWPELGGA